MITLDDFSGGYFTDVPSSKLKPSELLTAQNCYWEDGLLKRNGIRKWSQYFTTGTLAGGLKAYLNSTWYTVVAADNGATVTFNYGASTSFTAFTTVTFTTGYEVQMAELNGKVVAVNGHDKPVVIYYDSAFKIQNLETYDTRTLTDSDWYAGQYDAGATIEYIDDSTTAQNSSLTMTLATTTNNDGFWFSSVVAFNKIELTSVTQATGSPAAAYEYWNGTLWNSLSLTTTPSWTTTLGTRTMEWNFPTDWAVTPSAQGSGTNIVNNYAVRVRFTTAPSATFTCKDATLYHTQKLTEILSDDRPSDVIVHGNRMWLAAGYIVNYSPPNLVTGWRSSEVEYFLDGGPAVRGMSSFKEALLVFKDNALYEFTGNSLDTFSKNKVSDNGCVSRRSVAVVNDECYRVAHDGIYGWNGSRDAKVSKHISTDLASYTKTNAAAVNYKGQYWVSFPTNSITLIFDPDTLRVDDDGDARVSFYKFTNYKVNQFVYRNASGDTGYLLGLSNQTVPYIARCDFGATDLTPTTNSITMAAKTYRMTAITGGYIKKYTRLKPLVQEGSTYTVVLYADDDDRNASLTITTSGSGWHTQDCTIPYTIDGRNLSIYLSSGGTAASGLMAFYLDYSQRRF